MIYFEVAKYNGLWSIFNVVSRTYEFVGETKEFCEQKAKELNDETIGIYLRTGDMVLMKRPCYVVQEWQGGRWTNVNCYKYTSEEYDKAVVCMNECRNESRIEIFT